jgi:heme exporter protein D
MDDNAQSRINLLVAYFESARQELINRVNQRDNTVLLFLVAATAIFGVAFGNVTRPAILFAISPLGLGVAVIYTQHNTLIGQLGYYCGVEVTEQADRMLWPSPDSWETSKSLFDPALSGIKGPSQKRRGIPSTYFLRLSAIALLIPIPGVVGAAIAFDRTPNPGWARTGFAICFLMSVLAVVLLVNSARRRTKLLDEVAGWREDRLKRLEAEATGAMPSTEGNPAGSDQQGGSSTTPETKGLGTD